MGANGGGQHNAVIFSLAPAGGGGGGGLSIPVVMNQYRQRTA
jgi:hypothetical protein